MYPANIFCRVVAVRTQYYRWMRLCQDAVADISTRQKQFISVTKGVASSTASGTTLFFFYWRENESKRASLDVMHSFPIHKSLV